MAFIKYLLKELDFFGYLVQFRIDKNKKHKSVSGGISSLALLLFQ
jgi:hypothetical protein